ncbi:HAMP domain-containing histidine kinase [Patescibacteria group bacterium]|nr:HAMP domain-containing histidine kinase [Patescibacteria group bacterium]MCL5797701.1 HAMP domain-containing histidine kinase [Patescibacteria group bacterium]
MKQSDTSVPNLSLRQFINTIRNNLFLRASIRLTFIYITIIAVILFVFSQIIFFGFSRNIQATAERHATTEKQEEYFVNEAQDELGTVLVVVNIGILIFAGAVSYFLARITLSPIQKMMNEEKRFLSDASHELRTPLSILKANMEVTLNAKNMQSNAYKKETESNLEEVNRMTKLVNDLLLLSRLDNTGKQYPSTVRISLTKILGSSAKSLTAYAKSKKVTIKLKNISRENMYVAGDNDSLIRAIYNVLKNATDYNKKNGNITISLNKSGHTAVITISDTGIGIPKDKLPYIFNRFYRADNSRTQNTAGGSGLGLPITKAIIEKHKGEIKVESTEGVGTMFTINLPLSTS